MDYKIERMTTTEQGFQIARVLSYFDQKTYILHNRWGAWYIGDPYEKDKVMRAPETISSELPFDLQAFKNGRGGKITEAAPNVFMKPKPKVNPFIAKAQAAKVNPFITKAKKAT